MNKFLLPYDLFERHKKISSFIENQDTVIDIGGELNHLSQFCKPKKIIVANLTSGDILISKNKLPFDDNSFDVVCAIDVLEHIPKNKRQEFIDKLFAVARKKVLMSFPLGTIDHVTYEEKIHLWLKNRGEKVTYIEEHIKYGLPQLNEIKMLTDQYDAKITFSGNIKINELLFKIFIFDPKIKFIRKIIYFLKIIFNIINNLILYYFLMNKKYSSKVNRIYLEIIKK